MAIPKDSRVAVLSPSFPVPGIYPDVFEFGLAQMREIFDLETVECQATRDLNANSETKAADLHRAFSDPDISAIFSTIGGEGQVETISLLDRDLIAANPKPFFGFSDNTNLHFFLSSLGIPSFYGCAVMLQFAQTPSMDPFTKLWLQRALFETGEFELIASEEFSDIDLAWSTFDSSAMRPYEQNEGHIFSGSGVAEGVLWGGCLESMISLLNKNEVLPSSLTGKILCLETSELMPDPYIVKSVLWGLGERGWLDSVEGIMFGRPKAWNLDRQMSKVEKAEYRSTQRETVENTVRYYNKSVPIVQNVDFGHTHPQVSLPFGKPGRIDATNKKVFINY